MKYFSKIDAYKKVNILINGENKIKNVFGGILTLFTLMIILILSWIVGNDMIYRKSPSSFQDTIVNRQYQNITITKENFPIAFGLFDSNGMQINQQNYLNIEAILWYYNFSDPNSQYQIILEYERFNLNNFPTASPLEFNSSGAESSYCIKNQNLHLWGYYTSDSFTMLQLSVSICDDQVNSLCHNYTEIMKYISNNQIVFRLFFLMLH